jgi:hypothetical protein
MVIALLMHITLALPPESAIPPDLLRAAAAEAAALWAPYGVAVDVAARGGGGVVLVVVPVETRRSGVTGSWHGALGAIDFDADGVPAPRITLFLTDLLTFVSRARMFGQPEWQLPRSLREQIVARVLGRVLAHEIGHFVLRSKQHAVSGLMRPLQFADELVAPSRHAFALADCDLLQLAAR